MPTISIAMAVLDGARFLKEQLESFTKQTVLPSELIITDNGSTDGTFDIIAAFAATAPFPVKLEKNPQNIGYRASFMKAAGLCSGDLIAFSDSDDVWHPAKLEKCLAHFTNDNVLLAHHNATVTDENLNPIGTIDGQASPQHLNPPLSIDPTRYGPGFTFMLRQWLIQFNDLWPGSTHFYDSNLQEAHDSWFFFLATCLGTIAYINEPLALYRRHGNNSSAWEYYAGPLAKIGFLLSSNIDSIRCRQQNAKYRAHVLEEGQKFLREPFRTRAALAAEGYRKLEKSCQLRRQMYASYNPAARLSMLTELMRDNAYAPRDQWGSGRQALLRDILRGFIFPLRVSA